MISVVHKRARKPSTSDKAMRNFYAVIATPTMAKESIGKGSARSGSSLLLHASLTCMDVAGVSFLPCVLDECTKAETHFGSCVRFGVPCAGTQVEESRSRGSISGEGPRCNQTVTQKSNSRSQTFSARHSKGAVLMSLSHGDWDHHPD